MALLGDACGVRPACLPPARGSRKRDRGERALARRAEKGREALEGGEARERGGLFEGLRRGGVGEKVDAPSRSRLVIDDARAHMLRIDGVGWREES